MFLNEKPCGTVKGRLVAGGDRQRPYMDKSDVGSPTCATESIMLSALIDAHEGKHVATVDVPNAFVQTNLDETIIVKLRGQVAAFLLSRCPHIYGKYAIITSTNNQNVFFLLGSTERF